MARAVTISKPEYAIAQIFQWRYIMKNSHQTRCLRFQEINWLADAVRADDVAEVKAGEIILDIDDLKKYYEVSANALFSSKEKKVVKANETISLAARKAETLAIVGRVRLRKIDAGQGVDGAGNRDQGK